MNLNRREALRQSARFAAVAALGLALPARTWAALPAAEGWSRDDEALLNLIGDTILPATPESPGAGSVAIGRFIATMLRECQPPEAEALAHRALREIEALARERFANPLAALDAPQREIVLTAYERSAAARPPSPFRLLKELALLGYFTSEPGATQALRYDPVPQAYRGSVPLGPTDRSWAS
jgi:hypothetical protein